jgi:hypothetical protein
MNTTKISINYYNQSIFYSGLFSKFDSNIEWVQDPDDESEELEESNNKSYYSNDDDLMFEIDC